jgi:hypothetical protein
MRERIGRAACISLVQGFERQFAAASHSRRRPQCIDPVQDGRDDAVLVKAEPGATGKLIPSCNHIITIRPMPPRRPPRPITHFIATGRQQQWPRVARPPQDYKGAHDFNDRGR